MNLLVLPPNDDLLSRVERDARERGWTLDVSRGEEQTIVCVSAGGDAAELERSLPDPGEADVIALERREWYARRRARRRFLNLTVACLGVFTALGWAIPILGFLSPPLAPLRASAADRTVSVELPQPGASRRVFLGGRPVLVIHGRGGRCFGLSGTCTFMDNGRLEWESGPENVLCPVHGCTYDVHGNIVSGPAWQPLPSYGVERVGDRLRVGRRD